MTTAKVLQGVKLQQYADAIQIIDKQKKRIEELQREKDRKTAEVDAAIKILQDVTDFRRKDKEKYDEKYEKAQKLIHDFDIAMGEMKWKAIEREAKIKELEDEIAKLDRQLTWATGTTKLETHK